MHYTVTVKGVEKGEVFKISGGKWAWYCMPRGVEVYNRKLGLLAVRRHIARVSLASAGEVKLMRSPFPPAAGA